MSTGRVPPPWFAGQDARRGFGHAVHACRATCRAAAGAVGGGGTRGARPRARGAVAVRTRRGAARGTGSASASSVPTGFEAGRLVELIRRPDARMHPRSRGLRRQGARESAPLAGGWLGGVGVGTVGLPFGVALRGDLRPGEADAGGGGAVRGFGLVRLRDGRERMVGPTAGGSIAAFASRGRGGRSRRPIRCGGGGQGPLALTRGAAGFNPRPHGSDLAGVSVLLSPPIRA